MGLVSVRFLWPGLSREQRIHRQLLLSSVPRAPRPAAAALSGWLWLRWSAWFGWRDAMRTVRARGDLVEREWGVTRRRQLRAVLWCALAHGIPPRDFYVFQLYRPERRARAWEYVYGVETAAFHRWRTGAGDVAASYDLLQDKHAFADVMGGLGVPVVPTTAVVPAFEDAAGMARAFRELAVDGVLFAKPRHGQRAQGVVRAEVHGGDVRFSALSGRTLTDEELDRRISARRGSDDYVIQPYVGTHPELEDLGSARDEAVTVRLITTARHGQIAATCGYLEVPLRNRGRGYALFEIDTATGELDGADHALCFAVRAEDVTSLRELGRVAAGRAVPGWSDLVAHARCAHRQVPDLHSVAWDFIVGPYGPVLLEGNTNWGTAPLQIFHGPLLAERTTR